MDYGEMDYGRDFDMSIPARNSICQVEMLKLNCYSEIQVLVYFA